MPIGVARREIHGAEITSVAQNLVDQAHFLKECLPVERGSQAHARDDVAHCHAHGRLLLMFRAHDLVGAGSLGGEPIVEPDQDRADFGIKIAQPLDELDGECPVERFFFELAEHGRRGN